jgi:tape measure domain-containing protein
MSVGHLVVELELDDKKYTGKMAMAAKDAARLESSFGGLDKRLKGVQSSLSGTLPHLRDIAIVTSSLHSVMSGLSDTAGTFFRTLLEGNSTLEKTNVLLQGLSNATDSQDKIKEAGKNVKDLINIAKSAPFSLKEISNAFVKMETVGLDDAKGKVTALANAIASFGGGNEDLHRATVAIQQMASKGVISMEELRQQLGEAVPNAMQQMADGMGLSMSSLNKLVSEGKVKAVTAINAMMREMEFSVAGASSRMMDTWSGLTSQLQTNWLLAQKAVGDAGFFEASKNEVRSLNEYLQSDEAAKYAKSLGESLKSVVETIGDVTRAFEKNKNVIFETGKLLLEMWAITKAISSVKNIFGAASGGLGALKESRKLYLEELAAVEGMTTKKNVPAKYATVQKRDEKGRFMAGETIIVAANGSKDAVAGLTKEIEVAASGWKKFGAIGVSSLKILGGPIGFLILSVAELTSAYVDFGNKAKESLDEIARKQTELANKKVRVAGDEVIQTLDDLNAAKQALVEVIAIRDQLEQKLANAKKTEQSPLAKAFGLGFASDLTKQLAESEAAIEASQKAIYESSVALFDKQMERSKESVKKSVEDAISLRTTEYKEHKKLIEKVVQDMQSEKKASADINAYKRAAMEELHLDEIDQQTKFYESQKQIAIAAIDEIKARGGDSLTFVNLKDQASKLSAEKGVLISQIASIKSQIGKMTDGNEKNSLINQLKIKEEEKSSIVSKLGEIEQAMGKIKSGGGITDKDIVKIADGTSMLDVVIEKLKELGLMRDALSKNGLLPDGAIDYGDTQKDAEAQLGKAETVFNRVKQKLSDTSADYLKTIKPATQIYADTAVSFADMASVMQDASKDTTIPKKFAEELNTAASMLSKVEPKGDKDGYLLRANEMEVVIEQMQREIKAQGDLKSQADSTTKSLQDQAREQLRLNTGKDSGLSESESTIRIRREIDDLRAAGLSAETKTRELELSMQEDASRAKIEDLKKTHQINLDILADQKSAIQAFARFQESEDIKSNKQLLAARQLLVGGSEDLYQQDLENYKEILRERAEQHGASLNKELEDFIASKTKEYEEAKRIKIMIENVDKDIAQYRSLQEGKIKRSNGTDYERERLMIQEKHRQALEDAKQSSSPEDEARNIDRANKQLEESYRELEYTHRTAFQKMMETTVDYKQVWGDAAATFTNGFLDGLGILATEGTAKFKEFSISVINDISKMLIKMAALQLMQQAIGLASGFSGATTNEMLGNAQGAITGSSFNGTGPYASFGAKEFGGVVVTQYANGGAAGIKQLSKAERDAGGFKRSPHLALFAEAGVAEAFVPMKDGRTIPLSIVQGAGGEMTAQILLPNGRSIPGSIQKSNIGQFAEGGVMGGVSSSVVSRLPSSLSNFAQSLTDASIRIRGLSNDDSRQPSDAKFDGGGVNVEVNINITDQSTNKNGNADESGNWGKLANFVGDQVVKEIANQKRTNGLLWKN